MIHEWHFSYLNPRDSPPGKQLRSGRSVKDRSSRVCSGGTSALSSPSAQPLCQHHFLPSCFSMAIKFGRFCTAPFANFSTLLQVSESMQSLMKFSAPEKWGHLRVRLKKKNHVPLTPKVKEHLCFKNITL